MAVEKGEEIKCIIRQNGLMIRAIGLKAIGTALIRANG